jgi:probable HAF family extracellular repeat protein
MRTNGTWLSLLALAATACGSSVSGSVESVSQPVVTASSGQASHVTCDEFTTVDVPASFNATGTELFGNSPTSLAGDFFDNTSNQFPHGFVERAGVFTEVEPPNAVFSQINDVNPAGDLVGTYFDGVQGRFFAFTFIKDTFTNINPPSGIRSVAGSINAQKDLVGTYRKSDQIRRGFLLEHGAFITVDHPLAAQLPGAMGGTQAFGLNDPGDIVGSYVAGGHTHGYLLPKGATTFTAIEVPGATDTTPEGINNNGVIVGFFVDTDGNQHGFILNDGTFTKPVDPPGSTSAGTTVESITAAGSIAGTFIDSTGVSRGFTASCR